MDCIAESWFMVALFSSSLLFWSFVLFTWVVLVALVVWGRRILPAAGAAIKCVTGSGGKGRIS